MTSGGGSRRGGSAADVGFGGSIDGWSFVVLEEAFSCVGFEEEVGGWKGGEPSSSLDSSRDFRPRQPT